MNASLSGGNLWTYNYPVALAAGTYVTTVMFHGNQPTGVSATTSVQSMLEIVSSTNTGFTFSLFNVNGGAVLTATLNPAVIDYITVKAN